MQVSPASRWMCLGDEGPPGSQGKELSETLCLSVVSGLAMLTLLAADSSQLAALWETVNPHVSPAGGVG